MARPRPKPTFEGQLPQPERNPLALSVSALLHVVLILAILLKGRVVQQETGRPLSNAHLQMVGQKYATFADANGDFELHFDLNLMAECRVQYVTIVAPGYRSQMLPIVMGGGISTVPLKRR